MNTYTALDKRGRRLVTVKSTGTVEAGATVRSRFTKENMNTAYESWVAGGCKVLRELSDEEIGILEKQIDGLQLIKKTASEGYGIDYSVGRAIMDQAIKELNRIRRVMSLGGYIFEAKEGAKLYETN